MTDKPADPGSPAVVTRWWSYKIKNLTARASLLPSSIAIMEIIFSETVFLMTPLVESNVWETLPKAAHGWLYFFHPISSPQWMSCATSAAFLSEWLLTVHNMERCRVQKCQTEDIPRISRTNNRISNWHGSVLQTKQSVSSLKTSSSSKDVWTYASWGLLAMSNSTGSDKASVGKISNGNVGNNCPTHRLKCILTWVGFSVHWQTPESWLENSINFLVFF